MNPAPDELGPAPDGTEWLVIHTRPRCEKKISGFARSRSARIYLPLRRHERRYGSRLRVSTLPLFAGYVFLCADREFRRWLSQNDYVARVIPVVDPESLLQQLRFVHQALESGADVEVMPYLEVGRRVRVGRGPLRGLEGFVQSRKGDTRLVVNLDLLRESVAVEVDASLLEPA